MSTMAFFLKSVNWFAAGATGIYQSFAHFGKPEFWLWWCMAYVAGEKLFQLIEEKWPSES